MSEIKFLTFEEYMDCDNWKDVHMVCFGKDLSLDGEVIFKSDGLYKIEATREDENKIYVQMPNSKSCCDVPITDDLKFVAFWKYEYDSYIRKIKKEEKKSKEITISKERYEELLEIEAKYENLCK